MDIRKQTWRGYREGGAVGKGGRGGGPSEDSSLYPMSDGRIGE